MLNLDNFFQENSPENTTIFVDYEGTTHLIESAILIETIFNSDEVTKKCLSDRLSDHILQNKSVLDFLQIYASELVLPKIKNCKNNHK